jgi:hypothetical protein
MAYAKTSLRGEQRALRENMRALGLSHRQIAVEFARRYRLRPRAAWRHAYGWSLKEMAICHNEAGQPARAVEIYDEYLTADGFSRRDYGYFRALESIAVAAAGRPDDAAAIGRESIGIAAATGSVRTVTELSRLAQRLDALCSGVRQD